MKAKSFIDSEGRECTSCRKYKLFSEYARHSTTKTGYGCCCKECYNEKERKSRIIRKEDKKDVQLKQEIVHVREIAHEYWHGNGEVVTSDRPIRCSWFK